MMYCKSNYIPTFYSIIIQIIFHNKNDTTTKACIINWEFSQQNEKKKIINIAPRFLLILKYCMATQNQQKIAIFDRVRLNQAWYNCIFVLTEIFPLKLLLFFKLNTYKYVYLEATFPMNSFIKVVICLI